MLRYFRINILLLIAVLFLACGTSEDPAAMRLVSAREFYANNDYEKAKSEIDSIKILYPKNFEQIRLGLLFLDTVRLAENEKIIQRCDSFITVCNPKMEKMKSTFVYQQNKEYQESGVYVPKESSLGGISATTLRTGVMPDGMLYIESVYMGNQKHNRMKLSTKDGFSVQSLPVTDDGLNYRFSNLGTEYEVIRYLGASENGMAQFVFANENKPITATLEGKSAYSYALPQTVKSAIAKSYQLSLMMTQLDSLKTAKEKAEFHIYYLENKNIKKEISE